MTVGARSVSAKISPGTDRLGALLRAYPSVSPEEAEELLKMIESAKPDQLEAIQSDARLRAAYEKLIKDQRGFPGLDPREYFWIFVSIMCLVLISTKF